MATGYTENIEVSLPDLFSVAGAQTDVDAATKALDRAVFIIETLSGVVFEAEFRDLFLKKSDALWVKRATLFQAAWLLEHPDVLNRLGAASISQDGQSVQAMDDLTFVLAPLAKRALDNCSWHKHGTHVVASSRRTEVGSILISDNHAWSPIGSV